MCWQMSTRWVEVPVDAQPRQTAALLQQTAQRGPAQTRRQHFCCWWDQQPVRLLLLAPPRRRTGGARSNNMPRPLLLRPSRPHLLRRHGEQQEYRTQGQAPRTGRRWALQRPQGCRRAQGEDAQGVEQLPCQHLEVCRRVAATNSGQAGARCCCFLRLGAVVCPLAEDADDTKQFQLALVARQRCSESSESDLSEGTPRKTKLHKAFLRAAHECCQRRVVHLAFHHDGLPPAH